MRNILQNRNIYLGWGCGVLKLLYQTILIRVCTGFSLKLEAMLLFLFVVLLFFFRSKKLKVCFKVHFNLFKTQLFSLHPVQCSPVFPSQPLPTIKSLPLQSPPKSRPVELRLLLCLRSRLMKSTTLTMMKK